MKNKSEKQLCYIFLQLFSVWLTTLPLSTKGQFENFPNTKEKAVEVVHNTPITLVTNHELTFKFGEERMVLDDGLQPSMLCTKTGALVVQSQNSKKPFPQERIFYPYAMSTVISRDNAKTWNKFAFPAGNNGVDIEGGVIQLRDETILALETFVTPGKKADQGEGLLYYSNDDWHTLQGPVSINFNIPNAEFYNSSDDNGRPHNAMRLHRRILELPNGDLLTTIYGWQKGDNEPSGYTPTMKKTRVMLFRSKDKGRNWNYVCTVAADSQVGTEGFGEPVIARVSKGVHQGRLICLMRTGRELYKTISDNEGKTWNKPEPIVFAGRDVYATDQWKEMFKETKIKGELIINNPNQIIGAVVDPELLELRSGILVAAFGVRIPARAYKQNPTHPWNGNYLAFSTDGGDTWGNITQLTSGIYTTHYMAVEEMKKGNSIFVTYDFGYWGYKGGRYTYGRRVDISIKKK
jgi:hypothetical protein